MSSLMKRLQKASFVQHAAPLATSEYFKRNRLIPTPCYILNLAFSGKLHGGFNAGLHQLAGPSATFKSNLALACVSAFQAQYSDGIVLFYDSEHGAAQGYFSTFGIDESRVLHIPIKNLEELKFDIMKKLEEIVDGEKVMIFIDSIGNLASKKEVEDALKESSAADMTRAKAGKALTRMVTPYLTEKDITIIAINHTYDTQEMYSKKVVSGGTGWKYASHNVFIMGKRQIKDGSDLDGFDFIINVDKSRYIREKSALPISVRFDGGIDVFSGLLDLAVIVGWVQKPKVGWYTRPSVPNDKNWRAKDTSCKEFWDVLLKNDQFCSDVEALFSLTGSKIVEVTKDGTLVVESYVERPGETVDAETGEIFDELDELSE